jgi:hypothetical protein
MPEGKRRPLTVNDVSQAIRAVYGTPLPVSEDWSPDEPGEVNEIFAEMLKAATGDGAKKRQAGTKPSWKIDPGHETAVFSHLHRWKNGEAVDPDSGAHPLVHAAWRLLAIAFQETHGTVYTHKHKKEPKLGITAMAEEVYGLRSEENPATFSTFRLSARDKADIIAGIRAEVTPHAAPKPTETIGCTYCGKANDARRSHCYACGTPLPVPPRAAA